MKRRDQTAAAGIPRDGKRTERAKARTRTLRQERRLKTATLNRR